MKAVTDVHITESPELDSDTNITPMVTITRAAMVISSATIANRTRLEGMFL